MKQALDLVESIYSGTSDQARATMADLRQLRPEEAALITLGGLKRYASIVRYPKLPRDCLSSSTCGTQHSCGSVVAHLRSQALVWQCDAGPLLTLGCEPPIPSGGAQSSGMTGAYLIAD